jgi:hypothetical protein
MLSGGYLPGPRGVGDSGLVLHCILRITEFRKPAGEVMLLLRTSHRRYGIAV